MVGMPMKNALKSLGWGCAAIVALTVVAYEPALRGGFVMDDDHYVTENESLRSLDGLGKIWTQTVGEGLRQYYPLVFTTFWVEYHLWKLQPFGYHLVNVLLHASNAVLLWFVLRRLEARAAWWAAAVFALHPVQVESVAWIAELKNLASGMFSLLSLLWFLRFRPLTAAGAGSNGDGRFYVPALLAFLCALLCKTSVCVLPVVILALVWWKRGRVTGRDIMVLIPWFTSAAALASVTVWVEQKAVRVDMAGLPSSPVYHWLLAGRDVWFYLSKVVWPRRLTFIYPRWEIDVTAAGGHLFPVTALAVLAALWLMRARIGRGPFAAGLCFVVLLSPALGFFNVDFFRYSLVADRFQYLAGIALIASVVSGIATILHRAGLAPSRAGRHGLDLGALAGLALLLVLGTLTWRQAHVYRDPETLWQDTVTKNPSAWIAHSDLGFILWQNGKTDEAIGHMDQALRIKPDFAEGHSNLGNALLQRGRVPEAIEQYERALQIKPALPGAHYNLGVAFEQAGRTQEAIEQWELALQEKPDYVESLNSLGIALYRAGRIQEATRRLEQAVRIKPDYAEAHYNLGYVLEQAGKTAEAAEQYKEALRIRPDFVNARNRLARLRDVP
jgi:tetratricopeptide (TPR) repeat protein